METTQPVGIIEEGWSDSEAKPVEELTKPVPKLITLTVPPETLMEYEQSQKIGGGTGKLLTKNSMEIQVKPGVEVHIEENQFTIVDEFVADFNDLPGGNSFETDHTLATGQKVLMGGSQCVTLDEPMKAKFCDRLLVQLPAGLKLQHKLAKMELKEECEGTIVKTMRIHKRLLGDRALQVVAGGKIFAADGDYRIFVYDAATGNLLTKLKGHGDDVCAMSLSPDGKLVAIGSSKLIIFDTETYQKVYEDEMCCIESLSFSPCGKNLAIIDDSTLYTLYMPTKKLTDHDDDTMDYMVAYTPDSKHLCCIKGKKLVLMDASTMEIVKTWKDRMDDVKAMKISPDGAYVAVACNQNKIKLFGIYDKLCFTLKGERFGHEQISSLDFSPDSQEVAAGFNFDSTGNYISVFNIKTKSERIVMRGYAVFEDRADEDSEDEEEDGMITISHRAFVNDVRYCGDNIVSAGNDDNIIVWDARSGKYLRVIRTRNHIKRLCC